MTSEVEITFNGQSKLVPSGTSITALLDMLELQPKHVAVELNLEVVPREEHSQQVLSAGDRVEIVTLVGGG